MHPQTWGDFEAADAALAAEGRKRLDARVAYLATTTAAGEPRVHPVTPIVAANRLYLFMEPTSPKGKDLERNGFFALHCGVEDASGGEGEFFVSGVAHRVDDASERARAIEAASYLPANRYILFELRVSRATSRRYGTNGPIQRDWRTDRS